MDDYNIAVFDVGKTNKKFTLFSSDLRPILSTSTYIGEREIEGLLCDDVEAIANWILSTLAKYVEKHNVRSLAITTFGATIALVGENGELAMPVVSYNNEIDPAIRKGFYEEFGSPEDLYVRTGTPPLGQPLNVGVSCTGSQECIPRGTLRLEPYSSYLNTSHSFSQTQGLWR